MAKFAQMLAGARAPIMLLGGSRWSQAASRRHRRASRRNTRCRSRTTFRRGAFVRRAASLLRGRSRHRAQSKAARAHQSGRSGHSWSADGSANCRRRAIRCSTFRGRRCRSSMCIRAPRSSAASTARISRSTRRRRRLPRRSKISICTRPARRGRGRARRLSRMDGKADRAAGRRQFRRRHGVAARLSACRRHHVQRRRQLRGLDSPLLPLPPFRLSMSRRPRARWAMACRRRWR